MKNAGTPTMTTLRAAVGPSEALARASLACTLALTLVLGGSGRSDAQSIGSKPKQTLDSATLSGSISAGNLSGVTSPQQPAPTAAPSVVAVQPISPLVPISSLPREAVLAPTAAPTTAPAAPRNQLDLGNAIGQVVSIAPTQAPSAAPLAVAPSRAITELSGSGSTSSPALTDAAATLKTDPVVSLIPTSVAASAAGQLTLLGPTPQAATTGSLSPPVLASVVAGTTLQTPDGIGRALPASTVAAPAATEHTSLPLTIPAQAGMPSRPAVPKTIAPVETGEALKVAAPLVLGGEVGVAVGVKTIQTLQESQPEIASARVVVDPAPPIIHSVPEVTLGGGRISLVKELAPVDVLLDLKDAAGNVVRPVGPATSAPWAPRSGTPGTVDIGGPEPSGEAQGWTDDTVILVQLPLGQPSEPGAEFHWLYEVLEDGVFLGYTWSPEEMVDHESATVTIPMLASQLQGTLFLPASITPGYIANHDPLVHMWSGPTQGARSFGYAGPQFTTFTVVAPQVGLRLFVYSPVVNNYGWIDALGVGPVGAPAE